MHGSNREKSRKRFKESVQAKFPAGRELAGKKLWQKQPCKPPCHSPPAKAQSCKTRENQMSAEAKPIDLPLALHRGENDLPFVSYQERASFQLLQVDIDSGLWVVRLRAEP